MRKFILAVATTALLTASLNAHYLFINLSMPPKDNVRNVAANIGWGAYAADG